MQQDKSWADYVASVSWRQGVLWIATSLGVLTTAALGQWQLSRAAQKEALFAQLQSQAAMPTLTGADLLQPDSQLQPLIGRRVQLSGRWLAEHTVFLDNRPMQGRTGFYVLTPLQISGSELVVMVQRGWVPRNFEQRSQLPDISTPEGVVTLEGRLVGPPSRLYDLGGAETGSIRQNLDLKSFGAELLPHSRLQPQTLLFSLPHRLMTQVSVQQTSEIKVLDLGHKFQEDGLQRNWPVINSGVDKHYGYAFQWFALSLLMVGLFLWFQFFKPRSYHE
ncbi:MAG: SURF1 family protein [Betaproteobacteria bacterium]|nr:SURF1 family protein [Betaproteobacteria bacterium]